MKYPEAGDKSAPFKPVLHYAVRNSVFSSLGTVSTFLIGFVFAGLTIRYLGEIRGGYLMTVQALISINALIGGFGLATPTIRQTAILHAAGDLPRARVLVGSVFTANSIPALVFAVLIVVGFPWVFNLSKLDAVYRTDAFWATVFVACNFLISQAIAPWQTVYQSLQRYDLASGLATAFGLASGICGIIVLRLMPTMTSIALVGFCLAVCRFACDARFTRRLLHGVAWPTWDWHMIDQRRQGGAKADNVNRLRGAHAERAQALSGGAQHQQGSGLTILLGFEAMGGGGELDRAEAVGHDRVVGQQPGVGGGEDQ